MGAAAADPQNPRALPAPAGEERGAVQGGARSLPVYGRSGAARQQRQGDAGHRKPRQARRDGHGSGFQRRLHGDRHEQ